jgi:hypothetical protein
MWSRNKGEIAMTNTNYAKFTARLIAAWFVFSLAASALHAFKADPGRPPLPLGLAVLVPIAVFLCWFATSEGFRRFALALDPFILTIVQAWRVAGFVFLALYTYSILPGAFALPAGWGDMFIGASAPLVAFKLANSDHRKAFILWQVLGISDLVLAVTLGTTATFIDPHAIPTSPLTVLPLSLIPTFAVPLLLILHLICIAQARLWRERQHSRVPQPLSSPAA